MDFASMNTLITEIKSRQKPQLLLMLLLFLFPATAVTVNHAATGIFELIALLGFFFAWNERKLLNRYEKQILIAFALLFAMAYLSMLNTENMDSGRRKIGIYFLFILIPPAYFYIKKYSTDAFKALAYGAVPAIFIMLIMAMYQVDVMHLPRAKGVVHSIAFADTAALILCLLLILFFYFTKKNIVRVLLVVPMIAVYYVIVLTGIRGVWLFIPVMVLIFIIMLRPKLDKKLWLWLSAIVVAVVLLAQPTNPVRMGMERGIDDLLKYQKTPSLVSASWGGRIYIWKHAYILWKQKQWMGIGIGDYSTEMKKLIEIKAGDNISKYYFAYYYHAHNSYVNALLLTGIVGLFAFIMATIIMPLLLLFRYKKQGSMLYRSSRVLLVLVVSAFSIYGISESWVSARHFVAIFIIFLLVPMALMSTENNET